MADYVYFSPAIILLQDELAQHPPAMEFISRNCKGSADFAEKLAYLCTYCDILVDDVFTSQQEIDALCDIITAALYEKRTGILITH